MNCQQSLLRTAGDSSAAFTLTDVLVVVAILALLALTQLPARSGSRAPVTQTQCMNNLRQVGQAAMLYLSDNNESFPFGNRALGAGTGIGSVVDVAAWPMQYLRYLGNSTNQPKPYICPEVADAENRSDWVYQLHFMGNRCLVADIGDLPAPVRTTILKKPSIYLLLMEKSPGMTSNIRPDGFKSWGIIAGWNTPPGSPWMRRHNGGFTALACDGHVDWLRPPPYSPGSPPPTNLGELGDTSDGVNPVSTWLDGGFPKNLYFRKFQGPGSISF